jgi:hypothetical protein
MNRILHQRGTLQRLLKWFYLMFFILLAESGHGQMGFTVYPTEYQIKAKYLYNFTRYVNWPQEVFKGSASPYIIGIIGQDPFGIEIEKTVEGKNIKNRIFSVKRFNSESDLEYCHILFIGLIDRTYQTRILNKIRGLSILTVGNRVNFGRDGGIINFVKKKDQIRFEINTKVARESGLKISTKLLKMADIIDT